MKVDLISYLGSESHIASCARVSFSSEKRKRTDEDLIKFLLRNNHLSPFEMAELVFMIECPIFVARQILRHRTASVSEISGRHNQTYFRKFYLPKIFRLQSSTNKQMSEGELKEEEIRSEILEVYKRCYEIYTSMINKGISREMARIVLPLSTYTKFIWKMDLRNLMNFLKERMAREAQHEIRFIAKKILNKVEELFPTTYQFLVENNVFFLEDGFDENSFEIVEL